MILIGSSLLISDVEHLFCVFIGHLCIFFGRTCAQVPSVLKSQVCRVQSVGIPSPSPVVQTPHISFFPITLLGGHLLESNMCLFKRRNV